MLPQFLQKTQKYFPIKVYKFLLVVDQFNASSVNLKEIYDLQKFSKNKIVNIITTFKICTMNDFLVFVGVATLPPHI